MTSCAPSPHLGRLAGPVPSHAPTRRGLLLAAALLPLAACRVNNPWQAPQVPTTGARGSLSPDVATAVAAAAAISATAATLRATTADFPGLRAELAGLADSHRVHLAVLADAVPRGVELAGADGGPDAGSADDPAAGGHVPARRAAARQALLRAETSLREELERLTLAARSGRLARLLASMTVAVDQHLAVLGAEVE